MDYSIIIPAYNEQDWLPRSLTAVREAMAAVRMEGEVIVVDNNSADRTPRIALEHGARVVFEPFNQISRARNAGAGAAAGRYFIFVDADTVISAALLQNALGNLSGGRCCGGGVLVDFDSPLGTVERFGLDFWNLASLKLDLAAGCFIFCLRQGFEAVGGFSHKVYASEEIWFSRRLRAWGARQGKPFQVLTNHRPVTSSRKLAWFSPLQIWLTILVTTLFPFSLRFKGPCSLWYSRPKK